MSTALRWTPLSRFLLLYAAMYAAFGVASPFFPAFVNTREVSLALPLTWQLRQEDSSQRVNK